ncbi:hypothetical protein AB4Z43_14220 [Mesorhizobium sp. 2RAF45]|uniref:hypothetical protein n=1 Tax=Mesorhizobium sp. 2RAF45 TaxID=3233001 RepID=UPI003F98BC49
MPFQNLSNDRVTLVKPDGTVERENIPAIVTGMKIQVHDPKLPVEVGDHILRTLPSGMVEDYIVNDPQFHAGLSGHIAGFFIIHVRRSGLATSNSQSVIQNITNNFAGANSRVNINSTDMSTNVSFKVDMDQIKAFVDQLKPLMSALPETHRSAIGEPLAHLEEEVRNPTPSNAKIEAALHSIRTIAEGAAGNLVASGIVGMITTLFLS